MQWHASYRLNLPEGLVPAGGFPLLVALHGARESGSRLAASLEPEDPVPYARLYPDGPFPVEIREGEEWRVGHAWYHYTGDSRALERALNWGEEHLRRLLEHVAREHPIDPRRIALLGYSQGGYLASIAALRDRSLYRTLVAISCRVKTEMIERELEGAKDHPVLIVHGQRDRLTPIEPQERAVAILRERGLDVRFLRHERGHGIPKGLGAEVARFLVPILLGSEAR